MIVTFLATACLVSLCFGLHYSAMRRLAELIYADPVPFKRPLLLVTFCLFAVHLIEVLLYAVALSLLDWFGYGDLVGAVDKGPSWFFDHFYFSIASYTTLGIGDIVPVGPIRLIAGVEALNGLVLIAWSASFTYLAMERRWGPRGPTNAAD